jgi:hypothetical protein
MSDNIETIEIQGESSVDWQATAMQYIELNKQKTEAIAKVRKLHSPQDAGDPEGFLWCVPCRQMYPCPTITALDGEQ